MPNGKVLSLPDLKDGVSRTKYDEIYQKSDISSIMLFGNIKYYSKETLFQHKNKKYLDIWLNEIKILKKEYEYKKIDEYYDIAKQIGNFVLKIEEIKKIDFELEKEILNILLKNQKYGEIIITKIEKLSSRSIMYTSVFILFVSVFTIISVIALGYKVYINIGFSFDEINGKVDDSLIEVTNLNKEIEVTQKEVVFTMGAIGETRSKETGNHVKRVAEYSKLFALYYGIPEKEAEMLRQASPMHDIGKVAIPDNILNKPGKLTKQEFIVMKTHALLGYQMLNKSDRPLLKMASIVAYEHHEKWDGTGYPKGKRAKAIHIYGRITAIADVFDALGSDRVYKKAWKDKEIFDFFREQKGKHFKPKLVDIFFEHLDEFLKIRDLYRDIEQNL